MRNGRDCAIVIVIGVRMAFAGPFAPLKEHEKDDVTDLHRSVSQAGVFFLLLASAYFAPLRRFAAAYHQRQEALAAAEILAPLSRCATADAGSGATVATGPGTAGRTPASASCSAPDVALQGVTVRFAGRSRSALGDVSVFVPPQGVLGVTGPSGS